MLNFKDWKNGLRRDCELEDKLLAFNSLPEDALQVFWERGVAPTVQALIDDTEQTETSRPM
jgi:hypothetical protein